MQSKIIKKLKSFLSYSLKLFILTSFFLSQSFIAEIFLYQNNPNTKSINAAKADYNDHWYNQSFLYRKQITIPRSINSVPNIPHTDSNNTNPYLSNFPVLVSTTIPTNKVRSDHNDIIFTNQTGTALLNYEIESYDSSGNLTAWVKLPQLNDANNTTDTSFYMYYDNSGYTDTTSNTPGSTWNPDFKAVYHLKESPSTPAAGDYKDSTTNANNSTNTTSEPTATTSGQMGGAQSFNGSSYIRIGNDISMGTNSFTFDFWAKTSISTSNQAAVFAPSSSVASWEGFFSVPSSSTRNAMFFVTSPIFRYVNPYNNSSNTTDGSWHHFAGVCDRSQHLPPSVYLDGVLKNDSSGSYCDQLSGNLTFNGLYIGSKGTGYYFFNGSLDEVRISDTARSSDWIKTEYNNESSPSSFYNLGGEESYVQYSIPSTLAEVTSVPTPSNGSNLSYTFSSTKSGTITYGGDCSSSTTSAVSGSNIVTFNVLSSGNHSNCTIKVTDTVGNQSASLSVTNFTIDTNVTWYNVFWSYRKQITIDHTKVPHTGTTTNLSNFPILVSITNDNDLKLYPIGKVKRADGSDIVFANQAGTQLLNYEIESYDKDNGNLTAWVKIPTLYDASNSQDTTIYMYYSNSNAIANTQTNINGVWDDGGGNHFKIVQHMNQDPSGSAPQMKDSTSNHNNGTAQGVMTTGQLIIGKAGNALGFDGSNDYININNSVNMGQNSFTFEFWAQTTRNTTRQRVLYTPASGITGWEGSFDVPLSSTRNAMFFVTSPIFRYVNPYNNSSNTTDGSWHHFAGVCDRSRHLSPSVYMDGVSQSSSTSSGYCDQLTEDVVFNSVNIGGYTSANFQGSIDEVRISDTARSADWIKTEYNNESSPSNFYSLGGEENTLPPVLSEVIPVPNPTISSIPSYTFSSTKPGIIAYSGDCSSSVVSALSGNNTIIFNTLSAGTHNNCTIKVTDGLGGQSNTLSVASFIVTANFISYVIPAITDNKILPKSSISSSYISDIISTQMSSGEYKSASFVVNSNVGINTLQVEASSLTGNESTIPNSAVDIKTVKCWYQGGIGAMDYSVQGRYLTPELLLKDDSLISVDGDSWSQWDVSNPNGKNYLKISGSYTDISSGTQVSGQHALISDRPIQDASTLQPVNLPANYNKQFWITLHVPDNTPAGNYSGTINLKNGSQTIKSLNINIQVLPINLPQPNIEHSIYYIGRINSNGTISAYDKTVEQYTAEQIDMRAHGVTNPTIYPFGTDSNLLQELSIRQQAGMDNTNMYSVWGIASASDIPYYKNLTAPYGVVNLYQYGDDEQSLNDPTHRTEINDVHNAGGRYFDAQSVSQANSVADVLDLAVSSGLSSTLADKYHSYGHKIYSYGNPQTVPEYPGTFRRNYGLVLWQNNYDGAMDFAYQYDFGDIWNDFDYNTYRDHVLAYPTMNGVIDTIQWEGFREGVNDMRYLAALQNLITLTKSQGGDTATAIEAEIYLANLKSSDLTNMDLDAVRSQIINYILALQSLSHSLTVNHGTGSGFYKKDSSVTIAANTSQAGMVFDKWIGDIQYISNVNAETTTINMPSYPVSLTATYTSSWYDNNYSYRKLITINHTKIPNTDQSNFPVLVSLIDNSLKTTINGGKVRNANGYDIVFTLPDKTLLNYEIESYDNTTGKLVAWVKIPTLSSFSDTFLYMYYGNSDAVSSRENKTAIWDNHFKGVWHLGDTPSGHAAGDYKDSTTNANNSTNTTSEPTATTSGQMGGAQSFNGSSYIRIGNDISMGTNSFTFDFWAKTSVATNQQTAVYVPVSGVTGWEGIFNVPMSTRNALLFVTDSLFTYVNPYDNNSNTTNGSWHHFVGVCDRSQHFPPSVYLDGVLKNGASGSYCDQLTGDIVFNGLYIGSKGTGYYFFNGSLDEVRISDTARSADWIKTEYNNQSSPSTFSTLSSEENLLPPTITSLTANLPNGTYGTGTTVSITINFSKDVTSTGNITLTLNTTPQRTCSFTVTNDNSATCNYTIQGGDSATNLNATISGNIQDQFGNPLTDFTPLSNLSDNTTININTSSSPFIPPTKPNITNINITVLDNGTTTFNLPSNITQIAISRTPDFANVSWQDFDQDEFSHINETQETLYLKFRTNEGAVSDTIIITPQTGINNTISLIDGDIIQCKSSNDPNAVYIVKIIGTKTYIRHITSIRIFNYYKHLKWENLKQVDSLTPFSLSGWIRVNTGTNGLPKAGDKVYEINGDQSKHWINMTAQQFLTHGGSDEAIYTVNAGELNLYSAGPDVVSL